MRTVVVIIGALLLASVTAAQDYGYTYQNPTGNRFVEGQSTFPDVEAVDVPLGEMPLWVVGGQSGESAVWVVATESGAIQAVQVGEAGNVTSTALNTLSPTQPPLVQFGEMPTVVLAGEDMSSFTHPVPVAGDALVYVARNGDVVLWRDGDELDRESLNVLPDARPVVRADGTLAFYADATDERYVHAIMGDALEGASLVTLTTDGEALEIDMQVELPGLAVFEGISPFWADVDEDGRDDLVTTVSAFRDGSWLRVYNDSGDIIADSDPIGQGNRWRHQLAFGPFGIQGENQVTDVRTPHIGGLAEFFTLRGSELSLNNAQLGYTSHPIGSRNLDMGLAGDFDGDGKPELVVTNQARLEVVGLGNTLDGVVEMWTLPLDETLTTNFAAVRTANDQLALAAGTEAGTLHIWLPR